MPNCLHGHEALIGIQHDLSMSNLTYTEVDLSRSLSTILFLMTSGDLNIDLTQKVICLQKFWVFQRTMKRRLPFTAVRPILFFFLGGGSEGGGRKDPARFRTFQSPPGIGLSAGLFKLNLQKGQTNQIHYLALLRQSRAAAAYLPVQ